jgi:hypothetical protein
MPTTKEGKVLTVKEYRAQAYRKWYYKERTPEEEERLKAMIKKNRDDYRKRLRKRMEEDPVFAEEFREKQRVRRRRYQRNKEAVLRTDDHYNTFGATTFYGLRKLKKGLPYKSRRERREERIKKEKEAHDLKHTPVLNINKKKTIITWD